MPLIKSEIKDPYRGIFTRMARLRPKDEYFTDHITEISEELLTLHKGNYVREYLTNAEYDSSSA